MAAVTELVDLERIRMLLQSEEKDTTECRSGRAMTMKVLCLGMGRTGTTSLAEALKHLGFTPYDFGDRLRRQHLHLWDNAMKAKCLKQGKPWDRADFDKVTRDFDSLLDIPCCLFVDELINAYPEAKIILNVKDDPDKWLLSMKNTLFKVFAWPSWKLLQYSEPTFCGPWFRHVNLTMQLFCEGDGGQLCRQRYLEHNKHVREVAPSDQLMEYQITEGWEPLCRFLDLPIPEAPFPKANHPEEFVEIHTKLWWVAVYINACRIGRYSIAMMILAGLAWGLRWWI